jgi:hypothetical protein
MKTRKGFVSNSSSSSFVLLLTKEAYGKVQSKKFMLGLEACCDAKSITLGGATLVRIAGTNYDFEFDVREELKKLLSDDQYDYLSYSSE